MFGSKLSTVRGLLISDQESKLNFCNGVASDPRIKALAADSVWMADAREHRLNFLTLDKKVYSILVIPIQDGSLVIVSDPPGEAVTNFLGSVDFAWDLMECLLTSPFEGMIVVDSEAKVAYMSDVHEKFFGFKQGEVKGRPVEDVVESTRLHHIVKTGKAEIGVINRMRGVDRIVSGIPVRHGEKIVGAFGRVVFKGPEQVAAPSKRIEALEGEVEFYKRESATLKAQIYGLESIVGESVATRRLRAEIIKVAPFEIPVLIRGQSGTGKELVAHALHRLSPRRDAPMVNVNAAALPASLVEAELFGYEAGAFTGADKKGRKGKFEQAHGGTIFLDEIGDMPMEIQAKLLRVLQDRIVERVGGGKPREIDFRLVSATNKDLESLVEEGKFRLDLFYRISPIAIHAPRLRDRIDDIPLLVTKFLQEIAYRHARNVPEISADALALLSERPWPGNIRQLQHEIERAFVFSDGVTIEIHDLSETPLRDSGEVAKPERSAGMATNNLRAVINEVEVEGIQDALARFKGNKKRAAESLGISRSYLYKKLALTNYEK
jgi:transcriptional regulator with PAS, ATPase and Fis domain